MGLRDGNMFREIHHPKNHGNGLEIPEPCYTGSSPFIGGSNDS